MIFQFKLSLKSRVQRQSDLYQDPDQDKVRHSITLCMLFFKERKGNTLIERYQPLEQQLRQQAFDR